MSVVFYFKRIFYLRPDCFVATLRAMTRSARYPHANPTSKKIVRIKIQNRNNNKVIYKLSEYYRRLINE